jgi:hypothetical protein
MMAGRRMNNDFEQPGNEGHKLRLSDFNFCCGFQPLAFIIYPFFHLPCGLRCQPIRTAMGNGRNKLKNKRSTPGTI